MEGRWVHKIFSSICDQDKLKAHDKDSVLRMLITLNDRFEGLGFCLSEHGDMLSQWRGYAQNAEGFSVGFSKEKIEKLSKSLRGGGKSGFKLNKVNYDISTQRKELEPTYQEIKKLIKQGAFRVPTLLTMATSEEGRKKEETERKKAYQSIIWHILMLFPMLFQYKNPAFSEELEWRAVSLFIKNENDEIDFRATGNRLVPYRNFDFSSQTGIIKEVILGPKNQTPVDIVELALKKYGYEGVEIKTSEATYR